MFDQISTKCHQLLIYATNSVSTSLIIKLVFIKISLCLGIIFRLEFFKILQVLKNASECWGAENLQIIVL